MGKKLKQGIFYVFIANIINMFFTIILNFLLPKFLSINSYAAIKTFQLYITYVGIIHLGFVDGIYLKYGGTDMNNIDKNETVQILSTLRVFQILFAIILIIISYLIMDPTLFAFSLAVIPLNIISFFKMFFQAVGEFKLYSRITNISSILPFVINIILLFIFKIDNYRFYLISYVIIDIIIWILLEILYYKYTKKIKLLFFSKDIFKENIKSGFSLMCGNFASFLLTGLDRWFVKILMNNYNFAQYSFAVSIENILNVALTPISIPLYNYFCVEKSSKKINIVYKFVIIFAVTIISLAFVVKFILELFLKNYLISTSIIFYLFSAQVFQIIIKSIYINLYKVKKEQNKYFQKLIIVIMSGIIFNILCYIIIRTSTAFAIGTLMSSILWLFISISDFKEINHSISDIVFIFIEIFVFIICGLNFSSVIGFLIYVTITIMLTYIFMRKQLNKILEVVKIILNKKKNKQKQLSDYIN